MTETVSRRLGSDLPLAPATALAPPACQSTRRARQATLCRAPALPWILDMAAKKLGNLASLLRRVDAGRNGLHDGRRTSGVATRPPRWPHDMYIRPSSWSSAVATRKCRRSPSALQRVSGVHYHHHYEEDYATPFDRYAHCAARRAACPH